jgi:hypothetical protein
MLQEQKVTIDALVPIIAVIPSATGAPLAEVVHADATRRPHVLPLLDATVLDPCSGPRRHRARS